MNSLGAEFPRRRRPEGESGALSSFSVSFFQIVSVLLSNIIWDVRSLGASVIIENEMAWGVVSWFENACFLSYRHGQHEVKHRFVRELHEALSGELELLRNQQVYVDWDRLKGGDFYNDSIARALYQSVCMIVVYQPNYFDPAHTYCAREYRAMWKLEAERLKLLPNFEQREKGLVIPIILRGPDAIPVEITEKRQYEDFSSFMLADEQISKHTLFAPKIRGIATYIHKRCEQLEAAPVDAEAANEFRLPDDQQVKEWLRAVLPRKIPFPGSPNE